MKNDLIEQGVGECVSFILLLKNEQNSKLLTERDELIAAFCYASTFGNKFGLNDSQKAVIGADGFALYKQIKNNIIVDKNIN